MSGKVSSEYEYIQQLIYDRYWAEIRLQIEPIEKQIRSLLQQGRDYETLLKLQEEVCDRYYQLTNQRDRSEQILEWLRLDTLHRLSHKSAQGVLGEG